MGSKSSIWGAVAAGTLLSACAFGQVSESTTLETYVSASRAHRGLYSQLSWGETDVRFNDAFGATVSGIVSGASKSFDEAYVSWESGSALVRAGRLRTAFGLNTWSDLFYNGFNHIPLIRATPLVGELGLSRDDVGAEGTFGGPNLQAQVALVDVQPGADQFAPKHMNYGSLRLQTNQGDFVVGADYLQQLSGTNAIYGLDLRWTRPRVIVRGEAMAGAGSSDAAWGWYVDAAYRLPSLARLQAVGRLERIVYDDAPETLFTVGARYVYSSNLAFNLNYGWNAGSPVGYVARNGLVGWTFRTMYQLHF